jgi:hypothetical protein
VTDQPRPVRKWWSNRARRRGVGLAAGARAVGRRLARVRACGWRRGSRCLDGEARAAKLGKGARQLGAPRALGSALGHVTSGDPHNAVLLGAGGLGSGAAGGGLALVHKSNLLFHIPKEKKGILRGEVSPHCPPLGSGVGLGRKTREGNSDAWEGEGKIKKGGATTAVKWLQTQFLIHAGLIYF